MASSAKATSRARRSIAQSSAGVRPIASIARRYSSVRVMSETVRSSVESVTGTPRRWRIPRGWSATSATMPAWTLLVGHRSRAMPRSRSSAQSSGSSAATDPWAIRSGRSASARRTWAAPPHSPAWQVMCRPAARAISNARLVVERVREPLLRAGQVPADDAQRGGPAGHLGELAVRLGIRRAHGGDDEPRHDRMAGRGRPTHALGRTVGDGGDDVGDREAGGQVEGRAPIGSRRSGRPRRPSSRRARPRPARARPGPGAGAPAGRTRAGGRPASCCTRGRRARCASRPRPVARPRPASGQARARCRCGATRRGGGGAPPSATRPGRGG